MIDFVVQGNDDLGQMGGLHNNKISMLATMLVT